MTMNEMSNNRALIIGVGGDLPNTEADAEGLADVLCDPGRCAYPRANVAVLAGPDATRDRILAALDDLAAQAVEDATVVMYFSGHGYRAEPSTDETYWLMAHGYDAHRLRQTAVSGRELADRLGRIKARRLLLLLDCCHAQGVGAAKAPPPPGMTLTPSPIPPEAQALFAQGSGRVILASSRAGEFSFGGTPFSLFTRALVECLTGAATKGGLGDGLVRVGDLVTYASEVVPRWSRRRQHPAMDMQLADNFAVAYYAGGDLTPKAINLPPIDEDEIERLNQDAIRQLNVTTYTAHQEGGGAIAQGEGAQAVGAGGVMVGGNVSGSINTGTQETHYHLGEQGQAGGGIRARNIKARRVVEGVLQEGGSASEAADLASAQAQLRTGGISAEEDIEADDVVTGYVYIADPARATPEDLRREVGRLRTEIEALLARDEVRDDGDAEDARDAMRRADEALGRQDGKRATGKLAEVHEKLDQLSTVVGKATVLGAKLGGLAAAVSGLVEIGKRLLGL